MIFPESIPNHHIIPLNSINILKNPMFFEVLSMNHLEKPRRGATKRYDATRGVWHSWWPPWVRCHLTVEQWADWWVKKLMVSYNGGTHGIFDGKTMPICSMVLVYLPLFTYIFPGDWQRANVWVDIPAPWSRWEMGGSHGIAQKQYPLMSILFKLWGSHDFADRYRGMFFFFLDLCAMCFCGFLHGICCRINSWNCWNMDSYVFYFVFLWDLYWKKHMEYIYGSIWVI